MFIEKYIDRNKLFFLYIKIYYIYNSDIHFNFIIKMIIDDYLEYQKIYQEKYGENTLILMQVGSFFEMYSDNPNDTLLYKISDICNFQVSRKNKAIQEVSKNNALMAGFPLYVLQKYLQLLLQNNYTIILIEQVSEPPNPERKITEIISPSTNINITTKKSNYIMVLYFDYINNLLIAGISGIDLSTGKNFLYESGSTKEDPQFILDECYRFISIYNPVELLIVSDIKLENKIKEEIIISLNINNILVHYKWENYDNLNLIKKILYQKELLEKVYSNNSMLNIIEYLNLEKINIARTAFIILLQFSYEHNADIIKQLNTPEIIENNNYLNIEYNSALQLNIISNNNNEKPLLDILNRCSTAFGSRLFKERLLNPIINENILNKRYNEIDYLLKSNKFKELSKILNNIIDIERIKRKMILNKYNPQDWISFDYSLDSAKEAFILTDNNEYIDIINNIKEHYNKLNLNICSKYNLNDIKSNIFNEGVYPEIDKINNDYNNAYNSLLEIVTTINNIDDTFSKIEYNERDGYYISITKKRYDNALKINKDYISKFEKKALSSSSNILKLTSKEIYKISSIIEKSQLLLSSLVLKEYQLFVSNFIKNNNNNISILINILSNLDISCCNAKNAFEYRYYRPIIDNNENSYINAENLRHPIIERINTNIEYIGNDIQLNENGILLYGINASGKSSFMKAVGLNIIMAQSGMYVPSTFMKYSLYHNIMTRILGSDNIYKGMSSFVVEMTELRNILQRSNKNSLVIGDEICSGTEAISGVCIIASAINELIKNKASFIFTSHLHELTNIKLIKDYINNKLKIYHMHINIDENNVIIYERKLKEGQGSSIYGIEVCKSLYMPNDFMKNAENIRKELQGLDTSLIDIKKSNYNSLLLMNICEVCKINKCTETHHINYQSMSDNNGFFENYNKNIKHNLVKICEECHQKEHNGLIDIKGYKQTSEGIKLEILKNINNYDKLKIYIKRGKLEWFYRKMKNGNFKKTDDINIIIELINKINKSKINNIPEELYNDLFDPLY